MDGLAVFELSDFPIGSNFVWIREVKLIELQKNFVIYGNFKVLSYSNKGEIKTVDPIHNKEIKLSKNIYQGRDLETFIVPEFLFNHIHKNPVGPLSELQRIQTILLTSNIKKDDLVRRATVYKPEWLIHNSAAIELIVELSPLSFDIP